MNRKQQKKLGAMGVLKKNSSLGYAFGKMHDVNAHDIPISPPPNAPKCRKCGGHLRFFDNRTVCSKCGKRQ